MKCFFMIVVFLIGFSSFLVFADGLESGDIVVKSIGPFEQGKDVAFARVRYEIIRLYRANQIIQYAEGRDGTGNVVFTIVARQGVVDYLNQIAEPLYKGNIDELFKNNRLNPGEYILVDDNRLILFVVYQKFNGEKVFSVSEQDTDTYSYRSCRFKLIIKESGAFFYSENKINANFMLCSSTYTKEDSLKWVVSISLPEVYISNFACGSVSDREIAYARGVSKNILELSAFLKKAEEDQTVELSEKITVFLRFFIRARIEK